MGYSEGGTKREVRSTVTSHPAMNDFCTINQAVKMLRKKNLVLQTNQHQSMEHLMQPFI